MNLKISISMFFKSNLNQALKNFEENKETCFDSPLILVYSNDFLTYKLKSFLEKKYSKDYKSYWGEDLSIQKIDELFGNLSLFNDSRPYFFYHLEKCSPEVSEYLLKIVNLSNEKAILHFKTLKPNILKKMEANNVFQIQEYKDWEVDKFLDFSAHILECKLGPSIYRFFKQWRFEQYTLIYGILESLKLEFNGLDISESDLNKFSNFLDLGVFKLADRFSSKDKESFYQYCLLEVEAQENNNLFSLFNYLKSMLIKSQALVDDGKKLSFYDKKVLSLKNIFSKNEIILSIKNFADWEILLKTKRWSDLKLIFQKYLAEATK